MNNTTSQGQNILPPKEQVPLLTKIVYGTGDWGMASFNTIRQIFYAIFLTDVVGIDAGLASFAALIGIIWDAINDPIIGAISDRVRTRWGRRRPFLLLFAIPFGGAFMLLWWAPPWETQIALMIHITLAYMISDTLQTLVVVPFLSLTPEMTEDYDERTSLSTFRMFFNLIASLATAVAAPEIVAAAPTPQQGYLIMASIFGVLGILPFLAIFLVTRERKEHIELPPPSIRESLKAAWENIPFRIATGINLLNWITFDLVGLMLPFFLRYWIEGGRQRSEMTVPLIGRLTVESMVFFCPAGDRRSGPATLDIPCQKMEQAQRLHRRDALLGSRTSPDYHHPAGPADGHSIHGFSSGAKCVHSPCPARRTLPRCT
jgi:Na+/melibiose symporter-like transporter